MPTLRDSDYGYQIGVIRVLEKKLLKDDDILSLIELSSLSSILGYLRDKGYGEGNEDSWELILSNEEKKNNELLNKLKLDDGIYEALELENVYHNIKTGIKEVVSGNYDELAMIKGTTPPPEDILKAIRESEYDLFEEPLREEIIRAKSLLIDTGDSRRSDIILDRALLNKYQSIVDNTHDEFLRNYLNIQLVIANIKIAVRLCVAGRNESQYDEALSSCKLLNIKKLKEAALKGIDSLYEELSREGFEDMVAALKSSYSDFTLWCDNYVVDMMLKEKTKTLASGPVVSYFLARRNEIRMIRIIIVSKMNGSSKEDIMRRRRKMYG